MTKNKPDKKSIPKESEIVIQYVPIETLIPAEYNPRKLNKKQAADIKASLVEFGFKDPVIVNSNAERNNIIIGGHQRVKVWKQMGHKKVPVVFVDLNLEKEMEFNIRLNKNTGEFDFHLLEEFFDKDDLLNWGFEEVDFLEGEEIIELEEGSADAEPGMDKADKLQEKWGVALGDVWLIGNHRLVCGDSRQAHTVAACLNGAEPDLMITDPPYGVEYDASWRNDEKQAGKGKGAPKGRAIGKVKNDDNADWTDTWSLFTGSIAYIWHAAKFTSTVQQSLEDSGLEIRSQIIWAKNNFAISRGHYHWQHEPCFYSVREGATASWTGKRDQTTLWEIDKPQKSETGHSTQKPLECMMRPIRNHEGDVYEPFAGSGTTLVAAENLNRKCYAIEINPSYCAVILDRMERAFPKIDIRREERKSE